MNNMLIYVCIHTYVYMFTSMLWCTVVLTCKHIQGVHTYIAPLLRRHEGFFKKKEAERIEQQSVELTSLRESDGVCQDAGTKPEIMNIRIIHHAYSDTHTQRLLVQLV